MSASDEKAKGLPTFRPGFYLGILVIALLWVLLAFMLGKAWERLNPPRVIAAPFCFGTNLEAGDPLSLPADKAVLFSSPLAATGEKFASEETFIVKSNLVCSALGKVWIKVKPVSALKAGWVMLGEDNVEEVNVFHLTRGRDVTIYVESDPNRLRERGVEYYTPSGFELGCLPSLAGQFGSGSYQVAFLTPADGTTAPLFAQYGGDGQQPLGIVEEYKQLHLLKHNSGLHFACTSQEMVWWNVYAPSIGLTGWVAEGYGEVLFLQGR